MLLFILDLGFILKFICNEKQILVVVRLGVVVVVPALYFERQLDLPLELLVEFDVEDVSDLGVDHVALQLGLEFSVLRILVDILGPCLINT